MRRFLTKTLGQESLDIMEEAPRSRGSNEEDAGEEGATTVGDQTKNKAGYTA